MEKINVEADTCSESYCDIEVLNNSKEKLISLLEIKSGPCKVDKNDLMALYLGLKKVFFPDAVSAYDIRKRLKSLFYKQSPSDLCKKFEYFCCGAITHSAKCIYKWKVVRQGLLNLSQAVENENKPVFSIRKKQSSSCKVLLNRNQPFWVHKMYLSSMFNGMDLEKSFVFSRNH